MIYPSEVIRLRTGSNGQEYEIIGMLSSQVNSQIAHGLLQDLQYAYFMCRINFVGHRAREISSSYRKMLWLRFQTLPWASYWCDLSNHEVWVLKH